MKELPKRFDAVVFFDTETTGLNAHTARIIEFAAVKVTQDGLTDKTDRFIRLPEGEEIPEKIVELTGITDVMLKEEGIDEPEMASELLRLIEPGRKTLLIAHNAQFDICFLQAFAERNPSIDLSGCSYLDSLSVYKDRAAYPHKLSDAIAHYGLTGKVQNSHRAIDDVLALYEVVLAMEKESGYPSLEEYINLFGYNPKYGISGERILGITYIPQPYYDFKRGITLPWKK